MNYLSNRIQDILLNTSPTNINFYDKKKYKKKYKMSSFKDIRIITNDGIKKQYQELYQLSREERQEKEKQELLEKWRKLYYDTIFEECKTVFKTLVSKNYKTEGKFHREISKIKEKGIDFFEKVLDLDIPERYNTMIMSQFLMFKDDFYNCRVKVYYDKVDKNYNVKFYDNETDIILKDDDDDDESFYNFGMLKYQLNIKEFHGDERYKKRGEEKTEEEFLKKKYHIDCDWRQDRNEHHPEEFFLKRIRS